MTELEETKNYYIELLLYQYINFPKARQTISVLADVALCDFIAKNVDDAFNLDTSIGVQLDILGEYIGLDRRVSVPVSRNYFTFDDQEFLAANTYGLTDYTDRQVNYGVYFYNYLNATSGESSLNDDDYRFLLKLKLFLNSSKNTYYEITNALKMFFNDKIVMFDNLDMTITYFISNEAYNIFIITTAYLSNLLPKPMGVGIYGIFTVIDPLNVWSWGNYESSTLATDGFSDYESGQSTAEFLDYSMRL